jgi:hypothetical protein
MSSRWHYHVRASLRASLMLASTLLLSFLSRHQLLSGAEPLALLQLSADPYTNPNSQHQTQVEPDTFAYGSTIVAAFQSGRFTGTGSSIAICKKNETRLCCQLWHIRLTYDNGCWQPSSAE